MTIKSFLIKILVKNINKMQKRNSFLMNQIIADNTATINILQNKI